MKKAIVTGANGFVAGHLVQALVDGGIQVLALTRQPELNDSMPLYDSEAVIHRNLGLEKIGSLADILNELGWNDSDEIVFYHLAWKGAEGLADGSPSEQIQNIIYTAEAVKTAAAVGCSRFVNVGTVEELYFEDYLDTGRWMQQPYYSGHGYYAAAKAGAFKMNLILAYLEKIEYVQARFSVAVSKELKTFFKGYVAASLARILAGEPTDPPTSKQLYELVEVSDLSSALVALGRHGANKEDYYIGAGSPQTLAAIFEGIKNGDSVDVFDNDHDDAEFRSFFDNGTLVSDLNYKPSPVTKEVFL